MIVIFMIVDRVMPASHEASAVQRLPDMLNCCNCHVYSNEHIPRSTDMDMAAQDMFSALDSAAMCHAAPPDAAAAHACCKDNTEGPDAINSGHHDCSHSAERSTKCNEH